MESSDVQEQRQTAELDMFARRARPSFVLLNADYSVALAEWESGSELFRKLGLEARRASRLFPEVEEKVRAMVDTLVNNPSLANPFIVHESIVLRVSILEREGMAQIALFVEPRRRREDLLSAAKRYNLTQRQIEALRFILRGLSTREIAAELCIAETTVSDHFKQLLSRTAARNRADMVARVLNWADHIEVSTNPRK